MIEFLLGTLGELLLQVVIEALAELGLHAMAEPLRRPPNPWLAAIGYTLFGAIAGGLSLLVLSNQVMPGLWRIVNLVVTPVLAGLAMTALGAWRARRGDALWRIDRFAYGYLFALSLALVRFFFAG